ncbi:MAG: transketolase [Roseibium sp.]|uniref:transketolase n=1 Tax=Roseibium sp. TaxID=1936156 RepID=UPI001B06D05E|nr:transketolase [Roseibium sp.]MBO6892886.1 transketolase [Roseibium sp.]MBO6927987.1 transketolase [Roseibium sp.]
MTDLDKHQRMANAIRFLAIDAVEKAKSGHPGLPMGAADIATVLFTEFLKFDPTAPNWTDRDRFVLSAGHGSMLLYSLLYLLGYEDFSLDELKNFRQLGSRTAGHPEYGHGAGIETTTGPLGQGLGNAVGMAIAERLQADRFGKDLVDHYTYVLAGDGCLMEGISQEALTLAGHLKLNKLIVIWDDNGISIDGKVEITDSTNQQARFAASGWNTIDVDGHDPAAIADAIRQAQASDKPTLIAAKTTIGFGAPNKAGTAKVHGSPLGAEEIAGTREALSWPHEPFEVPSDILDAWRIAGLRSAQAHKDWQKRFAEADAELRAEFDRRNRGDLPAGFTKAVLEYKKQLAEDQPTMATRKASEACLGVINEVVPETIGGSADLTGSNNTKTAQTEPVTPDDFSGRYIHYGIREHGMAAAMNGIALHGGLVPYSGGFLIFSDYCRPSIRLAALMNQRVIHVMTHDSIGLGEDGPTHQPVEHFAALRAIPNLTFFRPADVTETLECWQLALESGDAPSILALTRQNLPTQRKSYEEENLCAKGAYVLIESEDEAAVTIFASGSEVEIAVDAHAELSEAGIAARVVSVPSFELFEAQSDDYKEAVIGTASVKIAVEAGIRMGWDRFIGNDGTFVGMTGFGASAPYKALYEHFGITKDAVVAAAKEKIGA